MDNNKKTRQDIPIENSFSHSNSKSSQNKLKSSNADRIQELESLIAFHSHLYYNQQPQISDAEFDVLWDGLKALDPNNPILSKVGANIKDRDDKIEHIIPMGSQAKVANPQELKKWAKKVKFSPFLLQYKLDGISIELQYVQGTFNFGVTRGDGIVGLNISENVKKMQGFKPQIDTNFTGGIRGEIIMTKEVFNQKYHNTQNPRNTASGISKRKDGQGSEDLTIICYDAINLNPDRPFKNELTKMEWLNAQGFKTVETKIFNTTEEVIEYRDHISEIRNTLNYEIDGLVIKEKEIDVEDMKRPRPEKQVAFKFAAEEVKTKIVDVEWSESGVNYTPIAIVKPVEIAGTTVQRASLSNPDILRALNIQIGSEVVISKRGDIIPHVERVISNPKTSRSIRIPDKCTACGTQLINEGSRLYCPNLDCSRLEYKRLKKWIKKLGILNFGNLILEQLFQKKIIKTIPDLYKLNIEDLMKLERVGEKSAKKALENLLAIKEIPLHRFIAGFHIEGMGERLVKRVVDSGYDTLEKLYNASESELANVKGFADITAKTLKNGIHSLYPQMQELLQMRKISIRITNKEENLMADIEGKTFCFTGKLETLKRDEAFQLVEEQGGIPKKSVVKDLDYLITNSIKKTVKLQKAEEQGTKIINEDQFKELIGI